MAAAKLGAILVNINPAYQPGELKYCLNKVGVKAVVASKSFKTQDYYSMLKEVLPEVGSSKSGTVISLMQIICSLFILRLDREQLSSITKANHFNG